MKVNIALGMKDNFLYVEDPLKTDTTEPNETKIVLDFLYN